MTVYELNTQAFLDFGIFTNISTHIKLEGFTEKPD